MPQLVSHTTGLYMTPNMMIGRRAFKKLLESARHFLASTSENDKRRNVTTLESFEGTTEARKLNNGSWVEPCIDSQHVITLIMQFSEDLPS